MADEHEKFEIIYHTRDDDSYMYSDTDYSWFVKSMQTGDEIASYSGHWYQNSSGDSQGGVESVEFDDDGGTIVATQFDGKVERLELPENVELVDGGRQVLLSYKDGRTETRPRRAVILTTKFGQPIVHELIGKPKD
jgi:hypothetical protein